jgi:5-methyltetrahydrofolate--homocysteine methyltransferase
MNEIRKIIKRGNTLLADGAMGTELQRRKLSLNSCPELYNVTQTEIIQSIHADYYAAGSDIVETNTFGGSRIRLAQYGNGKRVKELNRKAAEIAKEVCPDGKFVAGSMGPLGELIEPFGTVKLTDAYDNFKEQAIALAEGGADIIFVETMMSVEEAETAVKAVKEATSLPVSATMTFNITDSGVFTSFGVDAQTAVTRLSDAGADLIGSNCGEGVSVILAVLKEMQVLTELPLVGQPNAGKPRLAEKGYIYDETPEYMEPKIRELAGFNLGILGGCCGTTPDYIKMMRRVLDEKK